MSSPGDENTTSDESNTRLITQYMFKILVIGDAGAGKTSIIKRYVSDEFTNHCKTTIGVDFAVKVIPWDDDTIVRLQLWDIAGQERYGCLTRVYYKEATGALLVYDTTNRSSFAAVEKWKQDLDDKVRLPEALGGGPLPTVLLANKSDLTDGTPQDNIISPTTTQRLDGFCETQGFLAWFATSAKVNRNLDEAARCLVGKLLDLVQEAERAGILPAAAPADGTTKSPGKRPQSGEIQVDNSSAGTYYSRCCR